MIFRTLILLFHCFLATSLAIKCTRIQKRPQGGLKQIDASMGRVLGVTNRGRIVTLDRRGTWLPLVHRPRNTWKHVTVGPSGVWGVDTNNRIFKLVDGRWAYVRGRRQQLDAGGQNLVVGIDQWDRTFCKGCNIGEKFKYTSCGPYGCWGVGTNHQIYLRTDVTPTRCSRTWRWQLIGPRLRLVMVEVGTDGSVFGVHLNGQVFRRIGISPCRPAGTSWTRVQVPSKSKHVRYDRSKHVSYDRGHLWVITTGKRILDCIVPPNGSK